MDEQGAPRDSGEQMTNRIEYVFLEIPNCKKALTSEASLLDDLCFALGHMSEFKERPEGLDGEIFDLLFKSAEIVNFAARERKEYIKDMTTERDIKNQMAFAVNKGREEGVTMTLKAVSMLKEGHSVHEVCEATGLTEDVVQALR